MASASATNPQLPMLTVGIVSYYSPPTLLGETLSTLKIALEALQTTLGALKIAVVLWDNVPGGDPQLTDILTNLTWPADVVATYRQSAKNLGFGRAHNQIFAAFPASFHLVLNPDVAIDAEALAIGLNYLLIHPPVLAVTPYAEKNGAQQYLIKNYPAVIELGLRGFAPDWLKNRWQSRLDRYERRADYIGSQGPEDIRITSGCFLLLRRSAVERTAGFDPRFFLYFEDFDLTWRLSQFAPEQPIIRYLPTMKIKHCGGGAGQKNWRHRVYFIGSLWRFYQKHGWQCY